MLLVVQQSQVLLGSNCDVVILDSTCDLENTATMRILRECLQCHLPVVVVTSAAGSSLEGWMEAGASGLLPRPFNKDTLWRTLMEATMYAQSTTGVASQTRPLTPRQNMVDSSQVSRRGDLDTGWLAITVQSYAPITIPHDHVHLSSSMFAERHNVPCMPSLPSPIPSLCRPPCAA